MSDPPLPAPRPNPLRAAAGAWWRTTEWSVGISMRAGRRLLGVALDPSSAPNLVHDAREAARDLIGITDIEERVRQVAPTETARRVADAVPGATAALRAVTGSGGADDREPVDDLRARGEVLLHRSRDVRYEEDAHPAYERLLDSLAPDEARILRLMLLDGPQPAVDIRTGGPIGIVSSRLLAPGLSMIGARAGLRYVERVPAYLNNLNRLGLIWFSRETLRDPLRYQVLEAQPDVLEATHSVRQAKIIRRSIHLTPFGEGFCRAALVEDPATLADLPVHRSPEKPRDPQPPAG